MHNPFVREATSFGRALPRPGAGRIPLTVVTGFLGAGKTTLVREVLRHPAARNSALIVNEFGEVGVDDVLLRSSGEETVLIGNGCICCAASSDLHRTLRQLFAERERGQVPGFERVILETSGLADPSPMLQALATDRTLGHSYALNGVVAVVDAANALANADDAPEWARQVALADRIAVTKADLVDEATLAAVRGRILRCNALAPQVTTRPGEVDPGLILDHHVTALRGMRCEPVSAGHAGGYETFVVEREEPLAWDALRRSLDVLAFLRGADLLRVKGLVRLEGRGGPLVVHQVQHLAHAPEELASWPGRPGTRLVFITRNLPEAQVRSVLDAVWALADPARPAP